MSVIVSLDPHEIAWQGTEIYLDMDALGLRPRRLLPGPRRAHGDKRGAGNSMPLSNSTHDVYPAHILTLIRC